MARIVPARNDPDTLSLRDEGTQSAVAASSQQDGSDRTFPKYQVESDLSPVSPSDAEIEAIIRLLGKELDSLFS